LFDKPHGNQRVSDADLRELRRLYVSGQATLVQIAARYRITYSYASRLARGLRRPLMAAHPPVESAHQRRALSRATLDQPVHQQHQQAKEQTR
jgi:hypothetical protein